MVFTNLKKHAAVPFYPYSPMMEFYNQIEQRPFMECKHHFNKDKPDADARLWMFKY